jgi:hypothetical protein
MLCSCVHQISRCLRSFSVYCIALHIILCFVFSSFSVSGEMVVDNGVARIFQNFMERSIFNSLVGKPSIFFFPRNFTVSVLAFFKKNLWPSTYQFLPHPELASHVCCCSWEGIRVMAMEDQAKLGSQMLGVYQQELGTCFLNFFGPKWWCVTLLWHLILSVCMFAFCLLHLHKIYLSLFLTYNMLLWF